MKILRKVVVLLMLALWLPATLHCALEAAGMADAFACADEHQAHPEKESSRDSCDLIETASFKLAANTATVSLPALVALFPLFIVLPVAPDLTPPTIGVSELVAAPPEVARTWHFVVRAAPPARAPALAS